MTMKSWLEKVSVITMQTLGVGQASPERKCQLEDQLPPDVDLEEGARTVFTSVEMTLPAVPGTRR